MSAHSPRAGRGIAIWAVPRSVSTAFEKTFTCLPNVRVVHEPFANCYYFGPARRSNRYGNAQKIADFNGAQAMQGTKPLAGETVVFKDLCFQAASYVSDEFLASVTNTFILRHPDLVIASLRTLKPDFTEEELGFGAFGEIFERVACFGQSRIVVEGEILRTAAGPVLRAYCDLVGLPFEPKMLQWRSGRIRRWAPHEAESQAKWHSTLEASTGIEPPSRECPPPASDLGSAYNRAVAIYNQVAMHALLPMVGAMAS